MKAVRFIIRHRHISIVGQHLSLDFYRRADVVRISRDLLGQYLFTCIDGQKLTGGRIVETEAYAGATDRASHAYDNRRTRRTAVMYSAGGVAYVYLCYGLHSLFNIITSIEGIPHAVLIRALEPTHGIPVMLQRRRKLPLALKLFAGGAPRHQRAQPRQRQSRVVGAFRLHAEPFANLSPNGSQDRRGLQAFCRRPPPQSAAADLSRSAALRGVQAK